MKSNKLLFILMIMASSMIAAEAQTTTDKVESVAKAVVETAKAVENTAKAVTDVTKVTVPNAPVEKTAASVVPKVDYKDAFLGLCWRKLISIVMRLRVLLVAL